MSGLRAGKWHGLTVLCLKLAHLASPHPRMSRNEGHTEIFAYRPNVMEFWDRCHLADIGKIHCSLLSLKHERRCFPLKARRLLLIRHGQYELEDKAKTLTELGRRQAKLLAERLVAKQGSYVTEQGREHQVIFAGIWSSDVVRARETAEIIAEHLPSVPLHAPDPLLAEGVGALALPQWQHHEEMTSAYWEDSARIELAFRRYFHRQSSTDQVASKGPKSDVSFEIIVCHCNVIRYFVLRALQLPPEAWLRFGGYNTGITEVTIHSDGTVTLESFGDTGHLPLEMTTFH